MSLLIKALDKAQVGAQTAKRKLQAKQAELEQAASTKLSPDSETNRHHSGSTSNADELRPITITPERDMKSAASALELELLSGVQPSPDSVQSSIHMTTKPVKGEATKTNAANVFAAKRREANHQRSKVIFLMGMGLLALLAAGAYFYLLTDNGADVILIHKQAEVKLAPRSNPVPSVIIDNSINNLANNIESEPELVQEANSTPKQAKAPLLKEEPVLNELQLAQNEKLLETGVKNDQPVRKFTPLNPYETNPADSVQIASKSATIQISKTTQQPSFNPILMAAYAAYNAGNDSEAIKLYKQVLQRDLRNVDALLGLGALAQRQGRLQDANGWYGKVLEVEPKNSIALSFNLSTMLDSQTQDAANHESRIKNLLAKQPDDANLHAALGNFYADSNQWGAAQQAYFDAYRLNDSADNAYNLAISLDQLAKPTLALPYYQRALQLSQHKNASFDKAALEARIANIQ